MTKMAYNWTKVSKMSAIILISVNIVTMVFSILLFAFSLWIIASKNTLLFVIQTLGTTNMKVLLTKESLSLYVGIGLAVLSCFVFFICFMGFYGAITCSQFLLFMYSTLVLLLLLLECALMFYFSSNIAEKGIRERDGQLGHILRLAFSCCEVNESQNASTVALPWSCCGVNGFPDNCTASQSFRKNCKETFIEWWDAHETALYVYVSVLHAVLASCSLVRRACSASRSHT
ncbi:uncharacterized protein [Epargyreus clarus]|uniref:uncharacterized protein n=1 Tax=Epargyreus clarus TaxID=520877 RepID=UPI003C2E7092